MLNLVYCEFLKLKRSKIVWFSILGVLATPFLMLVEALQTHFQHPEQIFTLTEIYDSSLLYVMLLMNLMVYVAIAAYLFSREYTEHTLKTILPIPISRINYISAKFIMLFIWTIMLTFLTWFAITILMLVYHYMFGLVGFSIFIVGKWLFKFLMGSCLMFATISPFAYIAERTKGFVVPVIISAVVVMGSIAVSNQDFGALYPWTSSLFLINGKIQSTGYPIVLALGIIALISLVGFFATYMYFYKEDLK